MQWVCHGELILSSKYCAVHLSNVADFARPAAVPKPLEVLGQCHTVDRSLGDVRAWFCGWGCGLKFQGQLLVWQLTLLLSASHSADCSCLGVTVVCLGVSSDP